jgi:myo-inositol 2-dehydrogenase/D-chiro-inositol 1-dehydrogenase
MIAACAEAGVTFMVAHISRFLPAVREAHARIAQGEIGEPRMVAAHRLVDGYPNSGWPLDPAEGSSFLDWGSHGCDLMRWLVDAEPALAFGQVATYRGSAPTALSAMAVFAFEGGRMGHVWQSYEMAGPGLLARARYIVAGSEGTLDCHAYGRLDLDRGGQARTVLLADDFPGPGGAADMDGITFRSAFRDQLQGFAAAIAAGTPPPVTAQDGRTAVAMVLAAEEAAATGQAVRVAR